MAYFPVARILTAVAITALCTVPAVAGDARRTIVPGTPFSMNYGHLTGCVDLIDALDAHLFEEKGVRMHRTDRPATPAPDCTYLLPGTQFDIVKVYPYDGSAPMGFRSLCLRPTTQNETEACRWAIVFLP